MNGGPDEGSALKRVLRGFRRADRRRREHGRARDFRN
jgi:hypothetical protein